MVYFEGLKDYSWLRAAFEQASCSGRTSQAVRLHGPAAGLGALLSNAAPQEKDPAKTPLRSIRAIVTDACAALDAKFRATLERTEHVLIALKGLLQALLPGAFCYLRTERDFADRFDYEMLFR